MANITSPDKTTGQDHFAVEYQEFKDWMNSPSRSLSTFNPSAITLDGSGTYTDYTVTGNITLAFTGTPKEGNWQKVRTTGWNGTYTFTVPNNTVIVNNSFTQGGAVATGTYDLWFAYISGEYQINLVEVTIATGDTTPPQFVTASFEVGNVADNIVVLPVDEALDPSSVPAVSDFDVQVDASPNVVTNVDITTNSQQVRLTLTTAVTNGQTVTAAYTKGVNPLQDASGNETPSLTATAVTNNVSIGYSFTNTHMMVVDGVGEGIEVTNNNCFPSDGAGNDSAFSIFLRIKTPASLIGTENLYVLRRSTDNAALATVSIVGAAPNNLLQLQLINGSNILRAQSSDIKIRENSRYNIVVTYDGGESVIGVNMYVNGVTETSMTDSSTGTYTGLPSLSGGNALVNIANPDGNTGFGGYEVFEQFNIELSAGQASTLNTSKGDLTGQTTLQNACVQDLFFNQNANRGNYGENGIEEGGVTYDTVETFNIPNLVMYFDGDANVTEAGTGVSSWQSGNKFLTIDFEQGTDVNRPSYANPELTFVNTNQDQLAETDNISNMTDSLGYIWAVMKKTDDTKTMYGLTFNNGSASVYMALDLSGSGAGTAPNKARLLHNSGGLQGIHSTTSIVNNTYYLIYVHSNGISWDLYLNGALENNVIGVNNGDWTSDLSAFTQADIGNIGGSTFGNGAIKSCGFGVGAVPTTAERNALFNYLNTKYTIY